MNYKIDIKRVIDGNIQIQGWVLPSCPDKTVNFEVIDLHNNKIDYKLVRIKRDDVAQIYLNGNYNNNNFGFCLEFPNNNVNYNYRLIISTENEHFIEKINNASIEYFNTKGRKKKELILAYFNKNTFARAFDFLKKEGLLAFFKKTKKKLKGLDIDYDYSEWYELTKLKDVDLNIQRVNNEFKIKPFFSIVIPIFDTSDEFLLLLFKSILNQTYNNFEICIADATDYSKNTNNPKAFFNKLISGSIDINQYNYNLDNIHIKYLDNNKSIADNTNAAISMATGDYIVLCDHDDALTPNALYENVKVINDSPNAEIIYSDEDKVDMKDSSYFEPAFKPHFNLDMILSVNYFCHLTVIRKTLLDELYSIDNCYERAEYNGAQDYDLFLRLINLIINKSYNDGKYDTSTIKHIPKVLYHWRCHKKSTSKNVDSKIYAFENGSKSIEYFYKHSKINFSKVEKVVKGFDYGLYHTIYSKEYDEPLISIIIPNKDHNKDLEVVINSLSNGNYKNIEFVICENNSTENETFEYYESISTRSNIKIVKYNDIFNYSKINNFAASYASGEYLLFLNNDVEMISNDSLHEMLSYIKRSDVGAVGAKLLYKDKTIQHAGVIIGIGGIADHAFKGLNDFDHSYMNRAHIVADLNAVTAACLMTKKTVFEEIGGFDEKIAVAFNDIDLCLRIRERGKLVVYNPYSSFFHYESKSRGYEDTPEKVKRFNKEFAYFVNKWSGLLNSIDEYYNPNLTLRNNNFALRDIKYEDINEPFPIPNEIKEIINNKLYE